MRGGVDEHNLLAFGVESKPVGIRWCDVHI